jgi:alkaline phosphatase D
MKFPLAALLAIVLSACAHIDPAADLDAALARSAAAVRGLPVAPPGAPLPAPTATLTRIAFGSCQTAEQPIPLLDRMAADKPQLAIFMGDNVYGDARAGDMSLPELKAQYALLATRPEFVRLRAAAPSLATWDDHDFGWNDAGGDFSGRFMAKRLFETFWGARTSRPDGVYDAFVFGPAGRRVQIILLDTRFARTPLRRLPREGDWGRYEPNTDPQQRMLSDGQWSWLAGQLRQPADLRFIVSSIQVLADGHGWEAWRTLPREQARLYETVRASGAKGVVFVSGDRHIAGLYRQDAVIGYAAYELTTSSLNLSHRAMSAERSSNQIGDMYAPVNYGLATVDWDARRVTLEVRDSAGAPVRAQTIGLSELEAGRS